MAESSLVVGIAVDHDDEPDYGSLARRGIKTYRFPLRWSRVAASTTFYHDEPAVGVFGGGDDDLSLHRALGLCDAAVLDGVPFWPHDDPRWHSIDVDAWTGLPTAEVVVDVVAVHHYRVLMTTLRAHGVEPVPVLDPRDMPAVLCGVVGGWASPLAIEAYAQFARAAFMQLGHLADLWLGFVAGVDSPASGPSAHRALRHTLLAHARAASIYHRDLAGASGVARGRFGAILACVPSGHPPSHDAPSVDHDDVDPWFDRIAAAFQTFSPEPPPDRDDGFGWGFTTPQRALLSRSIDVVALDCVLPSLPAAGPPGDSDAMAVDAQDNQDAVRPATRNMALAIDRAVADLPGLPIIVCDGVAHDEGGNSSRRDERPQNLFASCACPLRGADDLSDDLLDDDDDDSDDDRGDSGDGNGKHNADEIACLAARFDAVRSAVSAGRPVSAYLMRPARS